jgi:hypothetical protein
MAILHKSVLVPTKTELLERWVGEQPWWPGGADTSLTKVGAFRLDDPAGAVGIEWIIARTADGVLLQLPLTYRDAPLDDGGAVLLGTMEHSVLGTRWTYDAATDPVAVTVLADLLDGRVAQAREMLETDGGRSEREPSVRVRVATDRTGGAARVTDAGAAADTGTSGTVTRSHATGTTIETGGRTLELRRVLDGMWEPAGGTVLLGSWDGAAEVSLVATGR